MIMTYKASGQVKQFLRLENRVASPLDLGQLLDSILEYFYFLHKKKQKINRFDSTHLERLL